MSPNKIKLAEVQGADGIVDFLSPEAAKSKAKAEWLAQGAELGANASRSAWAVGRWLVTGEELFLPPKPGSKRKQRAYYRDRKAHWLALVDEASKASGLAASSLRQYARVWRRGTYTVFPELKFGHHLEVMRCRFTEENKMLSDGKSGGFDFNAAVGILQAAKEEGWPVARTRAEVSRRFPVQKLALDALWKIKRILDSVTGDQKAELLAALAAELASMNISVENRPPQPQMFEGDGELPY